MNTEPLRTPKASRLFWRRAISSTSDWIAQTGNSRQGTSEELLGSYAGKIDELKARGGYVTADVIDVNADTPGLEAMLARFNSEHWHDEDEVRLIVEGRGLFHIHPRTGPVFAIEVEAGDLIRVPKGTHHWFDLCADRRIRAIRLFQDPSGWTPHYTESGVDRGFQPVCFGPVYFPGTGDLRQSVNSLPDSNFVDTRSERSCSTSRARRRRSVSFMTCFSHLRGRISATISIKLMSNISVSRFGAFAPSGRPTSNREMARPSGLPQ